jgi:hypothetical protein
MMACYFLKIVEDALRNIEGQRFDPEVAHNEEDKLFTGTLRHIAGDTPVGPQCTNPATCAATALKTEDIDFSRWCA